MMNSVRQVKLLDKSVYERIAAGEVVDRPASVIKELTENSLDAAASRVQIDIRGGGIEYMRVTDDGCGMSEADAALAVQRFATSKISQWEDLDSLLTLGFRGEALPSVAAVSRLEIRTCRQGDSEGCLLTMEGASDPLIKPEAAVPGTRITVRDLFFNTPARLKFLRAPAAEATQIIDLVGRLAAAWPEINFRLTNNDKEVFAFPAGFSSAQRLAKLWKMPDSDFLPVFGEAEGITLDGYIALPSHSRTNRNYQLFVMNGRIIRSQSLSQALFEGFSPLIERGRFPMGMIRLTVEPSLVDVNVHPTKMEVRFANPKPIFSVIYRAVSEALEAYHADSVALSDFGRGRLGEAEAVEPSSLAPTFSDRPRTPLSEPSRAAACSTQLPGLSSTFDLASPVSQGVLTDLFKVPAQSSQPVAIAPPLTPNVSGQPVASAPVAVAVSRSQPEISVASNDAAAKTIAPAQETDISSQPSGRFVLFGQVHNTYIVGLVDGELWVIDQHTAHERINYERFSRMEVLSSRSQGLLFPEDIELSPAAAAFLHDNTTIFKEYGYEFEPFGNDAVRLRSVPLNLPSQRTADTFRELVEEVASFSVSVRGTVKESLREKVRAMASCKASVRAGDALTNVEMCHLAEQMLRTDHSLYCPHGRPTRIALDKKLLERLFHRI